ncbi:MAG: hypothetical protein EPO43_08035 [Rugosibacter sp.]|nr:MAG: hypothetical protein EPO43_08035 [Rugosibacter sp.]
MSYLAQLKQLESEKISINIPEAVLTELTKVPSVSFGSTVQGAYEKNNAEKIGAGSTAAIWRVTYPDGRTAEVHCTPSATMAEILESRQGATAELLEPVTPRTPAPMPVDDEKIIRAWLAHSGETDPVTIADVLNSCQQDTKALEYFIGKVTDDDK